MKKIRVLILTIIIIVSFHSISFSLLSDHDFSTENDGVFKNITMSSGLSQSSIESVLVDTKGRIWIGTQDGLNRYNGDSFIYYKHNFKDNTSISNNTIKQLFEDSEGTIWVGTMNGGIDLYNTKNDNFDKLIIKDAYGKIITDIRDIKEDSNKRIVIATNKGIYIYDLIKNQFLDNNVLDKIGIEKLLIDNENKIWAATEKGFFSISLNKSNSISIYNYSKNEFKNIIKCKDNFFLVQEGNTNLLLFNTETKQFQNFELFKNTNMDTISAIHKDTIGQIWIGTFNNGIYNIDISSKKIKHYIHSPEDEHSLSKNDVRVIYEDSRNQIWIGTNTNGVSIYSYRNQKFHVVKNNIYNKFSLLDNTIRGFYYDKKNNYLWVASSKGVSRWDESIKGYIHYSENLGNFPDKQAGKVRGMFASNDGRLFVFSWNGISIYDSKLDKFIEYTSKSKLPIPSSAWIALYIDKDGYEYIGSKQGVLIKSPIDKNYKLYTQNDGLVSNFVMRFFEDNKNRVWFGTDHGISIFDKKTKKIINISKDSKIKLNTDFIFSFYENKDYYWLGSRGDGIFRVSKDLKSFKNYTEKDGLPNGTAYSILPSTDGTLYISSNKGIYSFNPITEKIHSYNYMDGIQNLEFNNYAYWQSKDGTIFMGGISGFNYFHPDNIKMESISSKVIINKVMIKGLKENFANSSKVNNIYDYKHRDILFGFYSLDIITDSKTKYKYVLEGYSKEWSKAISSKQVRYTNLPSGNYIFKVIATDSNSNWNSIETTFAFTIDKAPWETWWAIGIYIVIFLLVILLIIKIINERTIRIKKQNELLEAIVDMRTAELIKANKKLEIEATIDKLTHLYNRRKIQNILEDEIVRKNRYEKPLSILICDIDFFKKVNDTYGHNVGDEVLEEVALAMKNSTRETDFVGRWGGEEFIIVAVETNLETSRILSERIRENVENTVINGDISITISIGVVECFEDEDSKSVVYRADKNLYRAKKNGRNRVVSG
ncbi:ligand-binding sensor domain-containing protein [Helicovermis profundi]|uniref:Ligand-binding sensor domain-containing diguanylate cyclase n=1 Tax=Helicovermis profundi TaxID=3065157 RepID=A0AAU9EKL9_9FIRM|nr:ligand-binding sensor domain-containing diguanylate cyclase [Clostridia bacterium S502]